MALAVTPFGIAFGVAGAKAGLALWQTSGFSVLVFSGSAQLAAVDIVGRGGAVPSAIAAGLLLNLRSLGFGVAMAPSLSGPWWKRAAWSQLMIDEATAVGSAQSEQRWRRYGFVFAGVVLFLAWNLSTLLGATAFAGAGDLVHRWGIDAAIPAAFLALLWPRLASLDQRVTAVVGGAVALALVPIAPPGVPVIAAGLGVAAGWRARRNPSAA